MIVYYILAQGKISAPTVCLSVIYFDYDEFPCEVQEIFFLGGHFVDLYSL